MFQVKKIIVYFIRCMFDLYNLIYCKSYFNKTVQDTLQFCKDKINFYHNNSLNIESYPFITKKDIQENINLFPPKGKFVHIGSTSGTTGAPAYFYRDIRNMAAEQFFLNEYFQWKGKRKIWLRGDRLFPPHFKPDKIYKKIPFSGDIYISSFHLDDSTMESVVEMLQPLGNKVLWAYPAAAYLLAEYCFRNHCSLLFDFVATSSEKLYEYQANMIEKVFKCKIKDLYGQGERIAAFGRCKYGHYHELPHYSYVEYISIKDNLFHVAGTSLHNYAMPLIRYKMNDIFVIDESPCKCGSPSKNIIEIQGRDDDYLKIPRGILPGILFAAPFQKLKNIKESQIIQESKDEINVFIVKNEFFNKKDHFLLEDVIYDMIPRDICNIKYVDHIKKDPSGKLRFIINKIVNHD